MVIPFISFFSLNINNDNDNSNFNGNDSVLSNINISTKKNSPEEKINKLSDEAFNQETVRYEILENERWWTVLGWTKNLFNNERPIWSDIHGKYNCTKESIFLPTNNRYIWASDWILIIDPETTDRDGWQYAKDFEQTFTKSSSMGSFVRKRKWFRISKLKDKVNGNSVSNSASKKDLANLSPNDKNENKDFDFSFNTDENRQSISIKDSIGGSNRNSYLTESKKSV